MPVPVLAAVTAAALHHELRDPPPPHRRPELVVAIAFVGVVGRRSRAWRSPLACPW
jgi:hypothetical protein